VTSGNAKCRDWLVQPISVYRRMCIRPAAKSFLLRVLHMRSDYKSHSGVAVKLVDCCLWSVALPFVVVAGVCYVLALLSCVVRTSNYVLTRLTSRHLRKFAKCLAINFAFAHV